MNKRIESKRARGNLCRRFCRHISLHILIATHNVLSISWHDALQWGRCVCKQERWWMKISSSRRWKRHKERKKSFRIKGWRVILICIPCLYISFLDKKKKKRINKNFPNLEPWIFLLSSWWISMLRVFHRPLNFFRILRIHGARVKELIFHILEWSVEICVV